MSGVENASEEAYRTPAPPRTVAIASPVQSIESINSVISVLFSYKRSVMYKDIALATKLHPATVSQALSASRDIGLTKLAGKKGLYILTNEGEEYARLITANKTDDAKLLLKKILESNPLWTEILVFLKATRGQERDPLDLVLEIERKLGKKWSQGMRKNVRDSYVSILSHAGFIEKIGKKIISLVDIEEPAKEAPAEFATPLAPSETLPAAKITSTRSLEFAKLEGDDFKFEIRKDMSALEFARSQFLAWVDYLKKKFVESEGENR